jgi:RHS repeat-associated protein
VASTTSRTLYYDGAYAPFGESYAETGTTDRNFTGQNQDLTPASTGDLYDFLYREYHKIQGRWVSPDPVGLRAVDPANPQSWNRYAYVLDDPLKAVDPLGLYLAQVCDDDGNCWTLDTDNLTNQGYTILTDPSGIITSITGPAASINLVDSYGNVVATLDAGSGFILTPYVEAQSVTVAATGSTVYPVTSVLVLGPMSYRYPNRFAATKLPTTTGPAIVATPKQQTNKPPVSLCAANPWWAVGAERQRGRRGQLGRVFTRGAQ